MNFFKKLLLLISVCCFANAADKPNIILIMADDLGWGDVGYNGNEIIKTPHLDEMAANGLQMNRFYSASAVCSPTRGSSLTGRNPYRLGIPNANTGRIEAPELTLAEALKDQGYATGHFGKWHLGTLSTTIKDANRGGENGAKHFSPPWDNGFEVCFSTESKVPTYDPMLVPKNVKSRKLGWLAITDKSEAEHYGTHYWNEKAEVITDNLEGDDSRVITDRLIPFIDQSKESEKPFFAVVWYHTPHLPVVASPEHYEMYDGYTEYERNYYGCITAMDEQVGRIRQHLRDNGIADNTIIAFASDNGPEGSASNAPGSAGKFKGRKRSLYEGGIRVPGIIEWPAKVEPRQTDYPVFTSDYLPTIYEILGLKKLEDREYDGASILSVLENKETPRETMLGFRYSKQTSIMDNEWKLIRTNGKLELYDLVADPYETTDLAKEQPERLAAMTLELEKFTQSLNSDTISK